MPSKLKTTGVTGRMLTSMADRGGCMTADHRGFPPSSVFLPLRRRGLVELCRQGARLSRCNVWHLTPKGWDAIGMTPPVDDASQG